MNVGKNPSAKFKNFIDKEKLYHLIEGEEPSQPALDAILNKALKLKGLDLEDVAALLRVKNLAQIRQIMETAKVVKQEIYGKRLVLFAPVYTGNRCVNNCVYCSFRKDNKALHRKILNMEEIATEVHELLREGHKRLLPVLALASRQVSSA